MNEDPRKVDDIPEDYDRFRVGVTVFEHDPAKERYRNMLRLVAYDVRDPARLRRVAKACEDYGIRVEYSVFECDLSQELFQGLWARLTQEIDHTEDTILAYRICGSCVLRIASMGHVIRPGKVLVYMG